jgi:hypothetical protein
MIFVSECPYVSDFQESRSYKNKKLFHQLLLGHLFLNL